MGAAPTGDVLREFIGKAILGRTTARCASDVLAGFGVDLAERHGNEAWFIPTPATFVVDRAAIVRYAFVNADFTRRTEPEDIVEALRRIGERPS